ncbi:MAG: RNA polymerase sigma factor, partial [Planctomycetota bacterium]
SEAAREEFARIYEPVIRAYLGARWRSSPSLREVDDAVQDVFLDCFKAQGVLERTDETRKGGFRAYFYGVVRKVALLFERRFARQKDAPVDDSFDLDCLPEDAEGLSTVFDRSWAESLLMEAGDYQAELAREAGEEALRRVEILHLRFTEDMPIREIARLWNTDAAHLHHEYAKARKEFRSALLEVVAVHHPGTPEEVELEASRLLDMLN